MAIKITSIKRGLVTKGQYEGRPCTHVKLGSGMGFRVDTVLSKIVDLNVKLVQIEGDFTANTDILTVVKGLNSANYKIIFCTDSGDEVGPMVRFKNVRLSIDMEIPKEGEVVNYLPHITTYLRRKDEAIFQIKEKADYNRFRAFQKTKNIDEVVKILEVSKEYKDTFISILNSDVASMENLIIKYI